MAFPIIYIDTGGANTNSGSSDNNAADLSGTAGACNPSSTTVDLSGDAPDLSAVPTDGSATIYLAGATNSNQKIFMITAVDNTAKTVTVSVAPTGNFTGSAWSIGGRLSLTATSRPYIEGAVRAGWIVEFNNSPASLAGTQWNLRNGGDATDGVIIFRGKAGSRPVLTVTNTSNVFQATSSGRTTFENLEWVQQGASGTTTTINGNIPKNIKISDCGGDAFTATSNMMIVACEVSGVGGDALKCGTFGYVYGLGNYIHDIGGDGADIAVNISVGAVLINNIFDTCAGRGLWLHGAPSAGTFPAMMYGNTVYGCGDSGMESADADMGCSLMNNIFSENGNAAGEYNIDYTAGGHFQTAYMISEYNIFHHSGGGGGANLNGLTVSDTDLTSDPLFTDPTNGDFTLQSTSPAKASGFPGQFLGGPLGYLDRGAVQRPEGSGGGGGSHFSGFISG